MANGGVGGASGPKSDGPTDMYTWAVSHEVQDRERWHTQWRRNDDDDFVDEYAKLHERIGRVDMKVSNMRGQVTGWAAMGSFAGALVVAIIAGIIAFALRP